ncbi:MAG: TetR/AcrR family transcriptional regulator [Alphaproteobacteria bacterium]|jgi:AcrR family transcriptional regulator|nr:TetR/AcrR family transcriptional regulator [Alphaproteobacteria bacterium]
MSFDSHSPAEPFEARPVTKRENNRATNQEAILSAARLVFAELGYGGTTVRDIIRRTDLATGTFYNYFDNKEQVFLALNTQIGEELRALLAQGRQQAETFEQLIANNYLTYFTYFANNPQNYALTRSNRGRDGANVNLEGPQVKAGLAEMQADIEQAMALGRVSKVDAAMLTAAVGGVAFSILDDMMQRDTANPEAAAEFATRLFMSGIST